MSKVELDDITTGFQSTTVTNANSAKVEDELNNKVLYRNNPTGEPNQMESNLDMNSKRVLNLPRAIDGQEPATKQQLDEAVINSVDGVVDADVVPYTDNQANADYVGPSIRRLENEAILDRPTLASAVADATLVVGNALNIAERTTGNGGGAMWDVVLSSTVTENPYNIVQCTGVGTLSLVLREGVNISADAFGAGDGVVGDSAAIQAANDSLVSGPSGGGTIELTSGNNYTLTTGIVINPNVTLDCKYALCTYTGNGVAFTLGNSDTVLSSNCRILNLNLKLQEKDSTGVRLRGTDTAEVTGSMEGHTTVIDNTRTNIGVDIDGVNVSSFFNYIRVKLNHMHQGFRIGTTGSVDPTDQYFDNCSTLGDQSLDNTSIGYNFVGGSFGGQGSVINGGNIELCNTGIAFNSGAGQVTVIGTRFEISQTGTAWKLDFANGCDPCMFVGLQGFGTTYMESASGIRNFDSNSHTWMGTDGALRINGFDDPLNAKNFLGIGGTNPQLRFDSGADMNLLLDDDATGTGRIITQAGRGSGSFGAGHTLHGNAHASNPGEYHAYPSSATGTFKVTDGLGGATKLEVDTQNNHVKISSIPTASAGLPSGTLWSDSGTIKIIP